MHDCLSTALLSRSGKVVQARCNLSRPTELIGELPFPVQQLAATSRISDVTKLWNCRAIAKKGQWICTAMHHGFYRAYPDLDFTPWNVAFGSCEIVTGDTVVSYLRALRPLTFSSALCATLGQSLPSARVKGRSQGRKLLLSATNAPRVWFYWLMQKLCSVCLNTETVAFALPNHLRSLFKGGDTTAFCILLIFFLLIFFLLVVCQVWICRLQLPRAYLPCTRW